MKAKFLSSIKYVDYVYISNSETGEEALNLLNQIFTLKALIILIKNDKNLVKEKMHVKIKLKYFLQKVLNIVQLKF